jgi:hypothetical protein
MGVAMDGFDLVIVWAMCLAVAMGAGVGFWLISRRAPKGVVLLIAILSFVAGGVLAAVIGDSRIGSGVAGAVRLSGVVGIILGIIDLFHKRDVTTASRAASLNSLQATLGAPRKSPKKN